MRKILSVCFTSVVVYIFSCSAVAGTQYVRVVWDKNPANNATIGFSPNGTSTNRYIKYGTSTTESAWTSVNANLVQTFKSSLQSNFARLTGLSPNTNYYFRTCDDAGCGERYYFRTAPATAQPMTFIAGGDSRTNRSARQQGNRLVAKMRPHFVAFSGDFTDNHTVTQWREWLADWALTYSTTTINGTSYKQVHPIIPTTGNHESSDLLFVCRIFGVDSDGNGACSTRDAWGAFNIAGNLIRLYSLSTEFGSSSYANERAAQFAWLADDLSEHYDDIHWRIAQYHVPMYPRTSSKPGSSVARAWADTFYDYSVNLVIESDTHLAKYTRPVRPLGSSDYVEDESGTVYIGEGAWGAPLRTANRFDEWILGQDSFYHFMVVQVSPERMDIRTVKFAGEASTSSVSRTAREADPLALPGGMNLWAPAAVGEVLEIVKDTNNRSKLENDGSGSDTSNEVTLPATRDVTVGNSGYYTNGAALETDGDNRGEELRALVGWNPGNVPAGATLSNAVIRLNITDVSSGQYRIYAATSGWTESSAAWQDAANTGTQIGSFTPSATGTLNVTLNANGRSIVQGWLDGSETNNGIVIVSGGTTNGCDFSSSESSNAPQLLVTYQ